MRGDSRKPQKVQDGDQQLFNNLHYGCVWPPRLNKGSSRSLVFVDKVGSREYALSVLERTVR